MSIFGLSNWTTVSNMMRHFGNLFKTKAEEDNSAKISRILSAEAREHLSHSDSRRESITAAEPPSESRSGKSH